jgi:5'-nucleotidase
MRILLTNDDGPFSAGLVALAAALDRLGQVTVVCPAEERSGVSHAITHLTPVRRAAVTLPDGRTATTLSGTPADCVKFALAQELDAPPDLVVSGFNLGINAGIDLFYSGTVAAALEGGLNGVRSVAFSTSLTNAGRLPRAADIALSTLQRILAEAPPGPAVFNVNVPELRDGIEPAVRFTRQSTTYPPGRYHRSEGPRGRIVHWLAWEADAGAHGEDSDVAALKAGHVSVTPLTMNLTDPAALKALAGFAPACAEDT